VKRPRPRISEDEAWGAGVIALSIIGVTAYIYSILKPWSGPLEEGFDPVRFAATTVVGLVLGIMAGGLLGIVLGFLIQVAGSLVAGALNSWPWWKSDGGTA
jgi:hypothetical protein